eukprot:scaffold191314_cov21-Tisochrysis_lutea.AAC.1
MACLLHLSDCHRAQELRGNNSALMHSWCKSLCEPCIHVFMYLKSFICHAMFLSFAGQEVTLVLSLTFHAVLVLVLDYYRDGGDTVNWRSILHVPCRSC